MRTHAAAIAVAATLAAGAAPAAVLYDAGLGTLPSAQGWSFLALPGVTQSVGGGVYTLDSTLTPALQGGIGRSDRVLDTVAGFDLDFTLRITAESHGNANRAGFSVIAVGSDPTRAIEVAFWTDQVWVYTAGFQHGAGFATDTTDAAHDYRLRVHGGQFTLLADGGELVSGPLVDYGPAGPAIPYEVPNSLFFGDDTTSAQGRVELSRIALSPIPLPAALTLLVAPLGALLRRRARG
ncbi:MAG: hypothetical protein AB7Q97_15045 [Gammaproteobacteria bacterium]